MRITIAPTDNILERFSEQLRQMSDGKAHKGLARAINRTTDVTYTRVTRAIVKQSSIPRHIVQDRTRKVRVAVGVPGTDLEGRIIARGKGVPLKEFAVKQLSYGVRVKLFGKMQRMPGDFIFAGTHKSGIAAYNGHTLTRTGEENPKSGRNNAIRPTYGPSVTGEMVERLSKQEYERTVAEMLPARVQHELARLLPK